LKTTKHNITVFDLYRNIGIYWSDNKLYQGGTVGLSVRGQMIYWTDHTRNCSFSCVSTLLKLLLKPY